MIRISLIMITLACADAAQAGLRCYPARYGQRDMIACVQSTFAPEEAHENRFNRATRRLLTERYAEKGTFGARKEELGKLHNPKNPEQMTCTVFEAIEKRHPDFDRPLFTTKIFWDRDFSYLPRKFSDPKMTFEIGELAVSRAAGFGLQEIRALSIPMELFRRFVFFGRGDLILTTRAEVAVKPGAELAKARRSPWERLYKSMGFEPVGVFRHPRFPEWSSVAMHQTGEELLERLELEKASGMAVGNLPIPAIEPPRVPFGKRFPIVHAVQEQVIECIQDRLKNHGGILRDPEPIFAR